MKKNNKTKALHVRRGDKVKVISGGFKGKEGVIIKMLIKDERALVEGEGIIPIKKHTKPSAKFPDGGIIDMPRSIHISNLMVIDPKTGEPTRTKRVKLAPTEKKQRVSIKTGNIIPANI
jgi:large subunit ribosomal protein L24